MKQSKTSLKDIFWHGGKALLCAVQLFILDAITKYSVDYLVNFLLNELIIRDGSIAVPLLALIRPLTVIILFVVLWRYYDNVDDYSFNRFCAVYKDATEAPNVLRDPAYKVGLAVTALGATPVVTRSFLPFLGYTGMRLGECIAVGGALSLLLVAGLSLLRIKRRAEVWVIQKDLRTGNEKTRGVRHIVRRILYAVIFFASLCALIFCGFATLIPVWGSLLLGLLKLLFRPAGITVLALILPVFGITALRRLIARRKFMKRLERLSKRGELTYTVHGHPYLSAIFSKVFFGLTVTDAPHPEGKRRGDTTYVVGVISCFFRKGTIVLCARNVYRYMYAMRLRGIGGFGRGSFAVTTAQLVSVPAGSWFTNHAFNFPEGEGKHILLIDPTPRVLAIHGHTEDELIMQDNASEVFGYTVYGKNSFVNMLERT